MIILNGKPLRPLLAAQTEGEDLNRLAYPMLVSPKLDGIRVLLTPSGPRTRSLKKVPNKYINSILSDPRLWWLDGEIVVGDPKAPNVFNTTTSGVMSKGGTPDFTYIVFDHFQGSNLPFHTRLEHARTAVEDYKSLADSNNNLCRVEFLEHIVVKDSIELDHWGERFVIEGYEGLMARNPYGPYKFGRSTFKEQTLLKFKNYLDEEADIVGFEPLLRNNNPAEFDALGLQVRSSHKANKIPDSLLGKLIVENAKWGIFKVGSGFDVPTRIEIWENQHKYIGKRITYKYQFHGTLEKPRQAIFKGFRKD